MSVKILFLDIDGVLGTLRSHYAYGESSIISAWDITCCHMVKRLCTANGYKIVCSSTWRFDSKVIKHFSLYGLFDLLYEDWRTGADRDSRGEEIRAWLENHEEVTEYIILDDDSDFLPEQKERHIKTQFNDGFSAENFRKADELMGGKFRETYIT